MSKKRRTKQDKVIAELKRRLDSGSNSSGKYTYTLEKSSPSLPVNSTQISPRDYSYIEPEVKKSILITSTIFALNIGFFLIEKNLKFRFPGF